MATYNFYIQQVNASGVASTARDIETYFTGAKYLSCTGLENVGKAKDIYTEDYAESDGLRVYHPTDVSGGTVHYEATTIVLSMLFTGSSRRTSYRSFVDFVSESRCYYWDTARLKKAFLIMTESSEPSEDTIKGETYIKVDFTFQNIWGMGKTCDASGNVQ